MSKALYFVAQLEDNSVVEYKIISDQKYLTDKIFVFGAQRVKEIETALKVFTEEYAVIFKDLNEANPCTGMFPCKTKEDLNKSLSTILTFKDLFKQDVGRALMKIQSVIYDNN